jgi:hypothetical protein
MRKTTELNLHGLGARRHEVYAMTPVPGDYWGAVSLVPCPVAGCQRTVVWFENGYVPGYRACLGPSDRTPRHRFLAAGNAAAPTLIRDHCCEGK